MYMHIVISSIGYKWSSWLVYTTHCELHHLLCITQLECVYINSVTVYSSIYVLCTNSLVSDSVSYDYRATSLLVCGNQSMFTEFKIHDVHLSFCRGSKTKPVQRGSSDRRFEVVFQE